MRLLYNILIMSINNNNAIINNNNNNYGRLQDIILLFKIATSARKDFYEIYGQFEQAS